MNLTKKLLHTALLTSIIFSLSGCFHASLEPDELTKAKEVSINGATYVPEFDGLDPYLLAQEELVLGKKENWYIHNKKLYLFVDKESKENWFVHMDIVQLAAIKQWEVISAPTEEEKFEDMTDAFNNGTSF